jgi:single-strand DNA-binding protein
MASLNKTILIGYLGRDPEITYTPSGICCCRLSIATTENWNDKNTGEKREKTEWHKVVFWGKPAEIIGKYMTKGKQMYVEGRLQTSSYEKDGVTRYSTDIIGAGFQFLGGGQEQTQGQQQANPQNKGGYTQGNGNNNQGGGSGHGNQGVFDRGQRFDQPPDDDIPF